MKKITILVTSLMVAASVASAQTTLEKSKAEIETIFQEKWEKEIQDSLATGKYYLETFSTFRLRPVTDKTPKGLSHRSSAVLIRPKDVVKARPDSTKSMIKSKYI